MKATDTLPVEPIGIVISGLPAAPKTTVFTAFVWGPAPTNNEEKGTKAA